jgi:hypothetical protein
MMMKTKIKIYKMPLARVFPATHPRAGEETDFRHKITKTVSGFVFSDSDREIKGVKFHTIRAISPESKINWVTKIAEVQQGKAILVVYEWEGKPYRSMQKDLFIFGANKPDVLHFVYKYYNPMPDVHIVIDSGIGVQILQFDKDGDGCAFWKWFRIDNNSVDDLRKLAENEGLSVEDFKAWFQGYDLSKPLAIIHFTDFFRY